MYPSCERQEQWRRRMKMFACMNLFKYAFKKDSQNNAATETKTGSSFL